MLERSEKDSLLIYVLIVFVSAVCFLILTVKSSGIDFGGEFKLWVIYTGLAIVSELFPVELPQVGTGSVSVSFAINYATLLTFKPSVAALSAGIAMLVSDLRRPLMKKIFNFGQIVLATGLASTVFHMYWPQLIGEALFAQILAAGLAALVYATLNISLVTWVGALFRRLRFTSLFMSNMKWIIPNYISLALIGLLLAYNVKIFGEWGVLLFIAPLIGSRYIFQVFGKIRRMYELMYQSMYAVHEGRDPYTRGHTERVSYYAKYLAKDMGFPENKVDEVTLAGNLHDIGKVAISDEILNKPGKLTPEEQEIMEMHVIFGANLIAKFSYYPPEMANIVRYHHEWYNGQGGYPREVSGDDIPFISRMIAVCDSFDAMTTHRSYKTPISPSEAVKELRRASGTQFDPKIVEAFIRMLKRKGIIREEDFPEAEKV